MSKANPRTAQDMLKGVRLDKARVGNVWYFQIYTSASDSFWLERQYPAEVANPNSHTADEVRRMLRRIVMCTKLMEDTTDEDLQNLYDAKFGKGDGI